MSLSVWKKLNNYQSQLG